MILVGNPKGKTLLGIPKRRREDNIKMDLRGVVWGIDLIHLSQD